MADAENSGYGLPVGMLLGAVVGAAITGPVWGVPILGMYAGSAIGAVIGAYVSGDDRPGRDRDSGGYDGGDGGSGD